MTTKSTSKPTVLCVDDNPAVAEAVRVKLTRRGEFVWKGTLERADGLAEVCRRERPDLVILDVDLPGRDPFEALAELVEACPGVRTVMFSGHVRGEYITRSMDAGAWGYVSKNDGEDALAESLRAVLAGEIAFSPEAQGCYEASVG